MSRPFQKVYSSDELRPFDIMVTWQVACGKSQSEAYALAANIAAKKFASKNKNTSDSKSSKTSTKKKELTKAQKKARDAEWQKKFDTWRTQTIVKRGWAWGKLKSKVSALKKSGKSYQQVKEALGVSTRT